METAMHAKYGLLLRRVGDDDETRLVMSVLTTAQRIDEACAKMLAAHGLSEGRFAALLAIEDNQGASPAQIAERIGVTRATVTGLLDGLLKQGMVTRNVVRGDRRTQRVELTPAGAELLSTLIPLYRSWVRQVAGGIQHRERLQDGLLGMRDNLNEVSES